MVALLILLASTGCGQIEADLPNRAEFVRSLSRVKENWTQDQVRRSLGPPEDIWPANDSSRYVRYGYEVWCYGTSGHHTLPTLGRVEFSEGKVTYVIGGQGNPPSKAVIGEEELRDAMRRMYRPRSRVRSLAGDSQRLIQVSNLLIRKGQEKALAILAEYYRIGADSHLDDEWLFWLVRVMFTSNRPGGTFSVPGIGAINPAPPTDLSRWPTYPLFTIRDVPISLFRGATLMGLPEPFDAYLRSHQEDWSIRKTTLDPPDDPFPCYQELVESSAWSFPRVDPTKTRFAVPYLEDEGYALSEILSLVRSAYRPKGMEESVGYVNGLDYEKYHLEFLALKCRWDASSQQYVRGDGSVLKEPIYEYPQLQHEFKGIPGLHITITFSRSDDGSIEYMADCTELGRSKIGNAVLVGEEPDEGSELHWCALNDSSHAAPWDTTKDKVLAEPAHASSPGTQMSTGSGFSLAKGKRVRFVVLLGKKRYESPIFTP
jgi:hypothetical protein